MGHEITGTAGNPTNSNSNPNPNPNPNPNSNPNSNSNPNPRANPHANPNSNSNPNPHANPHANPDSPDKYLANAYGSGGGAGRASRTERSPKPKTKIGFGSSALARYQAKSAAATGARASSPSPQPPSQQQEEDSTTPIKRRHSLKALFAQAEGTNHTPFGAPDPDTNPKDTLDLTLADLTGDSPATASRDGAPSSSYMVVSGARRRMRASIHGTSLAPAMSKAQEEEFNTKVLRQEEVFHPSPNPNPNPNPSPNPNLNPNPRYSPHTRSS